MPEADPGSGLRTARAWVEYLRREHSENATIVACLNKAATALDLAITAERDGRQVEPRAPNKGGFPRT